MHFPKVPKIIQKISQKNIIWEMETGLKEIFLTFDDGPIPEVTPQVLDILDKYNAKATFFMIGENVLKYPDIKEEVVKRGHSVGNHTFNHLNAWKCNDEEYFENISKADDLINSELFRPPYGRISLSKIKSIAKNYKIVMWSILSGDYNKDISEEKCLDYVRNNIENGSIIVFHDSLKAKDNMLYALPKILDEFSNKNYAFKSINK